MQATLLSIRTTPVQIEIKTSAARLDRQARDAKLEIHHKPPVINMKTQQPMVLIDQSQCFAEAGLNSNQGFMREQGRKGMHSILNYTGKVSGDGSAMARIGHRANIMLDIIARDSNKKHEFGMGTMPKSRPKIDVTGGTLEMKAEPRNNVGEKNGVSGKYTPAKNDFRYTPGRVDIRMISYGSVDIKYLGNTVDGYI